VRPEYVFTYGTLRPSLATGSAFRLVQGGAVAGLATVRGNLFDLGSFPALVAGEGEVHGELVRVGNDAWLAALDAYEECDGPHPLYRREAWWARRPDGEAVWAWVYVYARPLEAARLIPSGDYRMHLTVPPRGCGTDGLAEGG